VCSSDLSKIGFATFDEAKFEVEKALIQGDYLIKNFKS
jgi:hypothetical protein